VTHSLFAVTLARTPLGRAGRGTLSALVIGANAPDIDSVAAATGGARSYLEWHRGPMHGPLGVVGLGIVTAGVVWLARRAVDRRSSSSLARDNASFGMLVSVSIIGVVSHILMDLPTSYGTRLFSPFDWHWFAFDWLPIVDIYLLMVLVAGLIFSEVSRPSRRRVAAIVLALVAVNYGIRATAHHQALTLAPRLFGPLLPPPCASRENAGPLLDRWPRPAAAVETDSRRACLMEIAAVPTFFSPFRWRIIAQLSNAYELHEIDLLDARLRTPSTSGELFGRLSVRYPNQWTPATFAAATGARARVFLGFSRFPAARSFVDHTGTATVRWSDMRFVRSMSSLEAPRSQSIFSLVVRVGLDGRVLQEEFGR